jgi:hypothetical protein
MRGKEEVGKGMGRRKNNVGGVAVAILEINPCPFCSIIFFFLFICFLFLFLNCFLMFYKILFFFIKKIHYLL